MKAKFLDCITDYNNKYLIGIDFDNTLSTSLFPKSAFPGSPVKLNIPFFGISKIEIEVIDIIKHWATKGDQFILWTCRTPTLYNHTDALADAVKWVKDQGIELIAVNDNHPGVIDNPRKILVDRIIDDNAVNLNDYMTWHQKSWNIDCTIIKILENNNYDTIKPTN